MCSSSPNVPDAPPATPRLPDEGAQQSREDEKRRQRMLAGRQSTLLTGALGATGQASTTKGTLLGG